MLILAPAKPYRGLRGTDALGSGAFGASRGDRKHRGLDFLCDPGDTVVAPISGRVILVGWAYPDANLGSMTIEGSGEYEGATVQLLYLSPVHSNPLTAIRIGSLAKAGDPIGEAQSVSAYYTRKGKPGMLDHIHMRLTMVVNPQLYLAPAVEAPTPA